MLSYTCYLKRLMLSPTAYCICNPATHAFIDNTNTRLKLTTHKNIIKNVLIINVLTLY